MKQETKKDSVFGKYSKRLSVEGWLKALLCGVIAGFSAAFIIAFITWFTEFNGVWLALGVGVGLTAALIPVFYFTLFRPTAKQIAVRVDRLGLEERALTMLELEQDSSYIAMRQREDAVGCIKKADAHGMRFRIALSLIVLAPVLFVLGGSMTAVTGLSAIGVVRRGGEVIDDIFPDPISYVAVSYLVEEGGMIDGEADQLIESGQSTSMVVAIADDGWMFKRWSDEPEEFAESNPARFDENVTRDIEVFAIFVRVEESEDNDGEQGDNQEAQDQPSDQPNDSESSPPPDDGDGSDSDDKPNLDFESNDNIIDGETYYREVYQKYYDMAMEMLANGEDIPDYLREIVEAYFNILL